ncbi:MAG: hypothetical protein WC917_00805 [Bacilli bacterium]|jgi:hypothetical protein
MLNELKNTDTEPYIPDKPIADFILKWYKAFAQDKRLKDQNWKCLGNTTLFKFWEISHDNYNVIVPVKNKSDWKRTSKRTITRDKANGFIAKMVKKLMFPMVMAQNKNQEIDNEASRIFRLLLEWWERQSRAARVYFQAIHTAVIEGTVHIYQPVINGREIKELVPNKEIYIPNFYQPDIQKQTHLIRAQITSYEEAKLQWGDNDNWKFVIPGSADRWNTQDEYFNNYETGIEEEDEVLIIYLWEHTGYDENNKPKQKLFNVLVNGVLMYEINDKQNLKHCLYPISKTVFEMFADVLFYWGNSLPNKIKYDQSFLDAYRTILLNKSILNLFPPLFNKGPEHIDEDVIVPAKITPTQLNEGDIFKIQGVADPITQSEINIEEIVQRGIDEGTQPPTSLGQDSYGKATLGEIQLKDSRANELLEVFGKMITFLIEDMGDQSLSNVLQFELKKNIEKLVDKTDILFQKTIDIGSQVLKGVNQGEMGEISLRFLDKNKHPTPANVAEEEYKLKNKGKKKEIIYVDSEYLGELDKFVYISANMIDKPSKTLEQLMAIEKYKTVYLNNPNIDQKEATRMAIRANDDDEEKLLLKEQPMMSPTEQPSGQVGFTPPTTRLKQSTKPKTNNVMPVA